MRQYVSISMARMDGQRGAPVSAERLQETVMSSFVVAHGVYYPGFVRPSYWRPADADETTSVFVADRSTPTSDLQVGRDGSWIFTRSPLDEEARPTLFLEALAWELTLCLKFGIHLVVSLRKTGPYLFGIVLSGFENGTVDRSGIPITGLNWTTPSTWGGRTWPRPVVRAEPASEYAPGSIGTWLFVPRGRGPASFYSVQFTVTRAMDAAKMDSGINEMLADLVDQLGQEVIGRRFEPYRAGVREARPMFDRKAISTVITTAWEAGVSHEQ